MQTAETQPVQQVLSADRLEAVRQKAQQLVPTKP